jgi:hypothetical protein
MKCPVCNADLPSTAKFCGGCGTTLSAAPPPTPPATPSYEQSYPVMNAAPSYGAGSYGGGGYGSSAMPAVKKKYKILRLIAVLMKILAIVVGALLIIVGLVMIVAGATASKSTPAVPDIGPGAFFGGLVGGLIMLVYGVFIAIFLYAYAEWMYVFMDIEENTRVTNEMLLGRK